MYATPMTSHIQEGDKFKLSIANIPRMKEVIDLTYIIVDPLKAALQDHGTLKAEIKNHFNRYQ
jgi:hypothetical protein